MFESRRQSWLFHKITKKHSFFFLAQIAKSNTIITHKIIHFHSSKIHKKKSYILSFFSLNKSPKTLTGHHHFQDSLIFFFQTETCREVDKAVGEEAGYA